MLGVDTTGNGQTISLKLVTYWMMLNMTHYTHGKAKVFFNKVRFPRSRNMFLSYAEPEHKVWRAELGHQQFSVFYRAGRLALCALQHLSKLVKGYTEASGAQ